MATSKQYAWYLEGNKVAIVEKDVSFDNDVDSKDYGPGASRQRWESPQSSVADGLEVKYTYAPIYRIDRASVFTGAINMYSGGTDGKLRFWDMVSTYINFDSYFDVGDFFEMQNAEGHNGLHKVTAFESSTGTNNVIVTDTTYKGSSTPVAFQDIDNTKIYYVVSGLEDESFEFDLPLYLQKALVYYVKGKLAEDAGELKLREYSMREFEKMIEKHENSRISGLRITSSGSHAIR
jgi:hypothetical protein